MGGGYTPSDSLATFLLPVPVTFCSSGLEVFIPEGGMLPPGDTIVIDQSVGLAYTDDLAQLGFSEPSGILCG